MRTVLAGLVALTLVSTTATAQVGHSRTSTVHLPGQTPNPSDDGQDRRRRDDPPAPSQTVTVSGGGLDPATERQIVEAVAEARKALARLRELQNARCESVKERADAASELIDAKLERILLAVEKSSATQPVQGQVVSAQQPQLRHPVVVTETDETPAVEGPPYLLPEEVERLSQAVASESFAEDQLRVLRLGFTGIPIQAVDAKALLGRFNFGEDKLKALQVMAPYLYDRQNAFQLLDAFTFSDDKAAAQRILAR